MNKFITDNINTIINGDCLDVMKELPDKCIDLVLTDPPYGIGIDGQKQQFCKNPKHDRKLHAKKHGIIKFLQKNILMKYLE